MAFEYGESYYGLRSFGSSAGDVKDASATVTATSGANGVNWIVKCFVPGISGGTYFFNTIENLFLVDQLIFNILF